MFSVNYEISLSSTKGCGINSSWTKEFLLSLKSKKYIPKQNMIFKVIIKGNKIKRCFLKKEIFLGYYFSDSSIITDYTS